MPFSINIDTCTINYIQVDAFHESQEDRCFCSKDREGGHQFSSFYPPSRGQVDRKEREGSKIFLYTKIPVKMTF
jgi:hypothetical protein